MPAAFAKASLCSVVNFWYRADKRMMPTMIAPRYAIAIAARYAPSGCSGFQMPGMKTVEEVRRERLALLREEAGSLVALNEKLGLSARDATLSQIINGAKNSRTGTPKQMGSKLARDLEAACGKEVGWMDTDPALLGGGFSEDVATAAAAIDQLPPKLRAWVLSHAWDVIESAREVLAGPDAGQAAGQTSPEEVIRKTG